MCRSISRSLDPGEMPDELRSEDLTLLGNSYRTGIRPEFSNLPTGCQIGLERIFFPSRLPVHLLTVGFFVGMWSLVARYAPQNLTVSVLILFVLIGILAIGGSLLFDACCICALRADNPILHWNADSQTISIHRQRLSFPAADVAGILLVARPGSGDEHGGAEAQLVVDARGQRTRYLLDTALTSSTRAYQKQYRPFSDCSGVRLFAAAPEGRRFRKKQFVVSQIGPGMPSLLTAP